MRKQSQVALSLSLATLASVLILSALSFKPLLAQADKIYVDKNCQINQSLPRNDRYTIFYMSKFIARGQSYLFLAARYQDGAGILCTFNVQKERSQLINLSQVKNQFIRSEISKDSTKNAVFIVPVAAGNGLRVTITDYKLDLNNPEKPILTVLRERRERREGGGTVR
jgi:hypothetical protein